MFGQRTMRKRPWWIKPLFFMGMTVVFTGVLVFIWIYNHKKPPLEDGPPMLSEDGREQQAYGKSGVSGARVKEHLSKLEAGSAEAVVVCPYRLLIGEEDDEINYRIYPIGMDLLRRNLVVNETVYLLTGVNYGSVLSDNVLKSVSVSGNGLYTQGGFLEEPDIRQTRDNDGEPETVMVREVFHPWDNGLYIDDNEQFYKETIYGADYKEIGVYYYPMM